MNSKPRRGLVAVPLLAVGLIGVVTAASAAYATTATWEDLVNQTVAGSPSDAALASATDVQLITLAVRCVPVDTETYCLHRGWDEDGTKSSALAAAETEAANGTTSADESTGDMSLLTSLKQWAALPLSQRQDEERTELEEAKSAVGKVIYYDAVTNGRALPADFATNYPDFASFATAYPSGASADTAAPNSLVSCGDPDGYELCEVMDPSKMKKQETGYYCGPTAMQTIAWNNPGGAVYKDQSTWASKLGTTQKNGTYIYNIKSAINSYTTWDNYAGTYIVKSIAKWPVTTWESTFRTVIKAGTAPILLHPRLNYPSNTSYYPGHTSGHFDVGRGYYADPTFYIEIFEPAGGPAEHNIYTPLTASDTVAHVRQANLDNTAQRDISY